MRLWSLHPRYLDSIWLVACWREWLLAKAVLSNKTDWYKNHPQLTRFKDHKDPIFAIDAYLSRIYDESIVRWYSFDKSKISYSSWTCILPLNSGQLNFEYSHLMRKLEKRNILKFNELSLFSPKPNAFFYLVDWPIEDWEAIK
ncbi:MAG: hypothetical protein ACD_2C00073G0012 [uncultured bacterium (gcode 4)]|uniref:DNA lyase n=1 Tax=uncultured bacterium (gcode 4) TaxID=1234023 RepID=K2GHI5_9BACT|nr:MAG: hypothetical protein ACD_2C00073G0012 [uncultured bacterium (gcode 4)]